jgi:hypothetical protein
MWEVEIQRLGIPGWPRQKIGETSSLQKKLSVVVCVSAIPASAGSVNKRTVVQACLGKKERPYLKTTRVKKDRGMTHACLINVKS